MMCRRLLLVLPLLGLSCVGFTIYPPFHRNPDLDRVARALPGQAEAMLSLALSPDGEDLYFLLCEGWYPEWGAWNTGELWKLSISQGIMTQVLEARYRSVATAPEGSRLVLVSAESSAAGGICVLEPETHEMRLVPIPRSDARYAIFSRTIPDRLYYSSTSDGICAVNLDGTDYEQVAADLSGFFALTPTDSVVKMLSRSPPAVDPSGRRCAVAVLKSELLTDIGVVDLATLDTTWLQANPYRHADLRYPVWEPDGVGLLFEVHELGSSSMLFEDSELWRIRPVLTD